jgi:N-acyl homoserine lactone hydrolase
MKCYVIGCGRIEMRAENRVTAEKSGAQTVPSIPVPCWLFQTEQGWVLFDTGCDPEGMTKNWPAAMRENPYVCPPEQQLTAQLARLGLRPSDIRCVVLSHLHLDHAGGLKLFPDARVIVSGEEFVKTMHAYADRDFSGFHLQSDIESWLRAEIRWELMSERTLQLTEELTILNLGPGHSYGMLAMLAQTRSRGAVLLTADAVYTGAHFADPGLTAGIVYDAAGYRRSVEHLRRIAERTGAEVWFGHDPEQFRTLVKLPDGCYE